MNDSVKVFVSDGRKDLKTDAVKFKLPWRDVVSAAIDSNLMSARNKTSSEVLCEGLKTSVAGWNASCSQYRYPHCFFEACAGLQENSKPIDHELSRIEASGLSAVQRFTKWRIRLN